MSTDPEVSDGYDDPAGRVSSAIDNGRQLTSVRVTVRIVIDEGSPTVVREETIAVVGDNSYRVRTAPSRKERLLIDGREFVRKSDAEPWRALQAEYFADRAETMPGDKLHAYSHFYGLNTRFMMNITALPSDTGADGDVLHVVADYLPDPPPGGTAELADSKIELWVTPEPSLIKQFIISQVFALGGRPIRRSETSVEFSDFNRDLQLPNPGETTTSP